MNLLPMNLLLPFCILLFHSFCVIVAQTYKAGVVLYKPVVPRGETPDVVVAVNRDQYVKLMSWAKGKVDILVFPEYGLTTSEAMFRHMIHLDPDSIVVGEVKTQVCESKNNSNLAHLACAAKANNLYVIVNLVEKHDQKFYITNVGLDPTGAICLKCRKQHLYNGTHFNAAPDTPNSCTFDANFKSGNVSFSVLFDTDMLYSLPAKKENVIMTSSIKNDLPFGFSLGLQSGFAIGNNVNLLVSGLSELENNFGGSGIYHKNGTIVVGVSGEGTADALEGSAIIVEEIHASAPDSQKINDYIAAVVEYHPINSSTANNTVEENLKEYQFHIEKAHAGGANIIVFPEYGLTGLVHDPADYAIEIPKTGTTLENLGNYWLELLAKAAKGNNIYIAVNLLEKAKDVKNKTLYYSTNIVFDRNGMIVAKYRKINLHNEPLLTPGEPFQNHTVFNTDFGITFGLLTSLDISHYKPSRSILLNSSVSDIIFPSAWSSSLPFHHSVSTQMAYATANKVNLLAASLNKPDEGMGGSGIYGANGTVFAYYLSGRNDSKLMIHQVQNALDEFETYGFDILDKNQSILEQYHAKRFFESNKYKFKDLNLAKEVISEKICHGSFCCSFKIRLTVTNSSDVYKLLAYSGPNKLDGFGNYAKICSLVACNSSAPSSCGIGNVNVSSRFQSISVETGVPDAPDYFYQPTSLTTALLPIFNVTYSSTADRGLRTITFSTSKVEEKVVAFGIYGNGSVSFGASLVFLVAAVVINYLL